MFCNGADTCDAGTCSAHAGNPCSGADGDGDCSESCDEAEDTCTAADPDDSTCTDSVFCNGADSCTAGICAAHEGSPCDEDDGDGNCAESCSELTASCDALDEDGAPCDDADDCTELDACTAGTCTGQPTSACVPLPVVCGDANNDGAVGAADARLALNAAVGLGVCPALACDYSGDGEVTTKDALFILRAAVGLNVVPRCPIA